MKRAVRLLARAVFVVGLTILIAAGAAPFISAERFSGPISQALAEALDRRVEISGPVRFRLFGGPGLTIGNVIIHDDPAIGIEPFAYVDSLEVGVRLTSLWKGRIEFSHLRLVEPSVNLVKGPDGDWDYLPLLERVVSGRGAGAGRFPEIQVRSGRLNFKYGDTKSVFYFSNADVDAWPADDDREAVVVRFEGEPARTDQPAQGFGELSGGGRLIFSKEGENRVDLNLRLLRSAVPEVLTLLAGQGRGFAGFIASSARLRGPMSDIEIEGELEMAEFDRRFLLAGQSSTPRLAYRGRLSLPEQELLLETVAEAEAVAPIEVRIRATGYFVQPKWAADLVVRDLPLEALLPLAGELGFGLPDGIEGRGLMTGAISWSKRTGTVGQLAVTDGSILVDGVEGLRFQEMRLVLAADGIELAPAVVELEGGATARVRSSYSTGGSETEVEIETKSLSLDRLNELWRRLTATEPAPLLRGCRGGVVAGRLACVLGEDGGGMWKGRMEVTGAEVALDGVADPLVVRSATVTLGGGQVELAGLKGRLGKLNLAGEYRFRKGEKLPHWVDVSFEEVPASEVERLLAPTLNRGGRGFIARTLRLRPSPPPAWLDERGATGKVRVARLSAGPVRLTDLEWEFDWTGTRIELKRMRAAGNVAQLTGRASINLGAAAPVYDVRARVKGMPWQGGWLDADGGLKTSGTGLEVVANARAGGSFRGRRISTGKAVWDSVTGCYEMSVQRGVPRLRLPCLELVRGDQTYYGMGQTTLTGALNLELFVGDELLRATGTWNPLEIDFGGLDQVR